MTVVDTDTMVLTAMRRLGCASSPQEIAEASGLSDSTVRSVLRRWQFAGLAERQRSHVTTGGRRPWLWTIRVADEGQRPALLVPERQQTPAEQFEAAARRLGAVLEEVDRKAEREGWRERALTWLHGYLLEHAEFFPDDVWAAGMPEPLERRWMGAVVREAARRQWITTTDRVRPRTSGNLTVARVWRSALYRPAFTMAAGSP